MAVGAGLLSGDNLPQDRIELLKNIDRCIEDIREEARFYGKKKNKYNNELAISKDMPNNFISILGGRGSGKTSIILTVLTSLQNGQCISEIDSKVEEKERADLHNLKENYFDNIVLDIIDPSQFNVEKNALGWIIYSFEEQIKKIKEKTIKSPYCDDKEFKQLEKNYKQLKENYIKSRTFYRDGIAGLSEGSYEYKKTNEEIIFAEMKLLREFRKFIDDFIEVVKIRRELHQFKDNENKELEPLIFITFDDIDISPEHGPEILNTVLNYLKHPNIVVFILGELDSFKDSIVIDSWNRQSIPKIFGTNTIITEKSLLQEAIVGADEFIEKILPGNLRNELPGLKLDDRLNFTPYGRIEENGKRLELLREILSSIKIKIMNSKNKDVLKEDLNIPDLLCEFKINLDGLENAYDDLKDRSRTFEGLDRYYLEFKNKQYTYRKYIEGITEIANGKQLKASEYIDIYGSANQFTNILFKYPRGLISFYGEFKRFTKEEELNLRPYYNLANTRFYSYTVKNKEIKNNFEIIYKLYDYLKKNNLELNENRDKYNIYEIFKIDYISQKVYINFKDVDIRAKEIYKDKFNVSQELLDIYYKKMHKLNDTQSAFIQFFYDLCKQFLSDDYLNINNDLNFCNIIVYKSEDIKLLVNMINLPYFYQYYLFQSIYEICMPIILQDRKVHRNIRSRLKNFYIYALYNLKNYKFLGQPLILSKWKKALKEWDVKEERKELTSKDEVIDYFSLNFRNIVSFKNDNFKEENKKQFNILEYILYFEEIEDMLVYEFSKYINSNKTASIYSNYVIYLKGSSGIKSRIDQISVSLEYEDVNDINKNKLMKKLQESVAEKTNNISYKWGKIKTILAEMDSELIKMLLISICEDENIDINAKTMSLDKIYIHIDKRIVPENISSLKSLLTICNSMKANIRNNDTEALETIKDALAKSLEGNIIDNIVTISKHINNNMDTLIKNDERLNVYQRLIKLIGDGRKNDTKISEIQELVNEVKIKDEDLIIFDDLVNNYYKSDNPKTYYAENINIQLFKILEKYFIKVVELIWKQYMERAIKIEYLNDFIEEIERQLSKSNYKKYICNNRNEVLINRIKNKDISDEMLTSWINEYENILGEINNE